jgi:hypothetical protein
MRDEIAGVLIGTLQAAFVISRAVPDADGNQSKNRDRDGRN